MYNNSVFLSTQIQGRLDDLEVEKSKMDSLNSKISSLKSQYLQIQQAKPITRPAAPTNKRTMKQKTGKVPRKKKVKSITSHVTNAHKDLQSSIMKVLSGKKRKVNDILNHLRAIEEQEMPTNEQEDEEIGANSVLYDKEEWVNIVRNINLNFPQLSRPSKLTISLITKKYLNYPTNYNSTSLSSKSEGQSRPSNLEDLKQRTGEFSMWHTAGTPPLERLTDEEIRWLYDIGDQDDLSIISYGESCFLDKDVRNVLTLSQVLENNSFLGSDEIYPAEFSQREIPNSSPEPELLVLDRIVEEKPKDFKRSNSGVFSITVGTDDHSISTDDVVADGDLLANDYLRDKNEIFEANNTPGDSQMNAIQISGDSSSSPVHQDEQLLNVKLVPTSLLKKPAIEVPKSFTESLSSRHTAVTNRAYDSNNYRMRSSNEIITSSPPSKLEVPPLNLKKSPTLIEEISSSLPLESEIDQLPDHIFVEDDGYIHTVDQEQGDSIGTVYSTAQSEIYFTQRPNIANNIFDKHTANKTKTTTTTTEMAIKGRLAQSESHKLFFRKKIVDRSHKMDMQPFENIANDDDEDDEDVRVITTKVIGVHRRPIDVDEVPNSSSDEEDISIIEIVREIKHDNSCLIEVPSSQNQVASSPIDEKRDNNQTSQASIFAEADTEVGRRDLEVTSEPEGEEGLEIEDFTKLTTDELKGRLNSWGLKIGKGRAKMIDTLSQASKIISQSQKSAKISQSQALGALPTSQKNGSEVKSHIFERITYFIKENSDLYEKILIFEPISMADFQKCLRLNDIRLDTSLLREYCDKNGVTLLGTDEDVSSKDTDMDVDDNQ